MILNLATGMTTHIERNGGLYELELWLRKEDVDDPRVAGDFVRQGP